MKLLCLYIGSLLLVIGVQGFAQNEKALRKAEKAYSNKDYAKAIDLYKEAYSGPPYHDHLYAPDTVCIMFKLGECYRMLNDIKNACQWYAKSIKAKCKEPVAFLYLAEAERQEGYFSDAIELYTEYKTYVPSDTRADDGIKACQEAKVKKEEQKADTLKKN